MPSHYVEQIKNLKLAALLQICALWNESLEMQIFLRQYFCKKVTAVCLLFRNWVWDPKLVHLIIAKSLWRPQQASSWVSRDAKNWKFYPRHWIQSPACRTWPSRILIMSSFILDSMKLGSEMGNLWQSATLKSKMYCDITLWAKNLKKSITKKKIFFLPWFWKKDSILFRVKKIYNSTTWKSQFPVLMCKK